MESGSLIGEEEMIGYDHIFYHIFYIFEIMKK